MISSQNPAYVVLLEDAGVIRIEDLGTHAEILCTLAGAENLRLQLEVKTEWGRRIANPEGT